MTAELDTTSEGKHHNRTLSRGLAILELVAANPEGTTVGELALHTGLDKGTTSRLVSALQELGYLFRREDRRIVLTGRVTRLTRGHEEQFDLKKIARPFLERLCRSVNETITLSVRQGTHVLYVDQVDPQRELRVASQIGRMVPLHDTAMGRAMLFAMPAERRRELLRALALEPEEEPGLALDEAIVERELGILARTGFVTVPRNDDLARAAAVILGENAMPVAAVGVYGPAYRMRPRFREIGKACRITADQITMALAGSAP
jgi:DNA-binding IclR family transcriptional regulator